MIEIVCTIGPASWDQQVFNQMAAAGMNYARVNGAFADTDELDKVANLVRNCGHEVKLMLDVKGPEIRLNEFPEPIPLVPGKVLAIGNDDKAPLYPANHPGLYKQVKPGQRLSVGDGDIELTVVEVKGEDILVKVEVGGLLKPGKALNLPGSEYAPSPLTQKDIQNIEHAANTGWEFVSASFVQTAEAARYINSVLQGRLKLIAKIEDQSGIDHIDAILPEVWGVMVARGGLGVELGLEKVPQMQRLLIDKTKAAGKFCVTATQMLESMHDNPRPTRAEVNDVATAVWQGTSAVMLSGETSAGKYPVKAVEWMRKIADQAALAV